MKALRREGLPVQKLAQGTFLADTAKEVEADVLKLAEKLDNDLVAKMKTSGIDVNEADKTAFINASKAIYEEFSKQVAGGQALIDKSLSLAKDGS